MEPRRGIVSESEEIKPLTEAEKAELSAEFAGFDPSILAEIDPNDGIPIFSTNIASFKSMVHYDEGVISKINGAVVRLEHRQNISYEWMDEPLPNGDTKATGISIRIDSDALLSDIFENAPFGIIKKNRTGVGATTLELKSPRNSIIVVPTKSLAYTKAVNDEKYLYVGSEIVDGIPFPSLKNYLQDDTIEFKKFIVVADSLYKVIDAIGKSVYDTYFLMVDEIDIYQSDSTFRPALENAMDYYFKFDYQKRCLVSATIRDFCNPKINEEDVININYTQPQRRQIFLVNTDNPHAILKEIIEGIFANRPGEKIFIAYNKILFIRQIIENLSPECKRECAILCSDASRDHAGTTYYKSGLARNNTLPKRINFATNPYFAGIDVNEKFHLISVSNVEFLYTLLSPDRYLQIAGRCREKEGVYSETIVYNTKPYIVKDDSKKKEKENGKQKKKNILTADSYGRYLLEMAYDVVEYISRADALSDKYKSYGFWDESFVQEVKDDLLKRTNRYYYRGTKMPLVRKNVITGEYSPAFFNVDSLRETLKLRIDLYTNPDNLYNALRESNDILSYTTQNRDYEESQLRNEAIATREYDRAEDESLASTIEKIRQIASMGGLRGAMLGELYRTAKRGAKTFVGCVGLLYKYIPMEQIISDLIVVYGHATLLSANFGSPPPAVSVIPTHFFQCLPDYG